MEETILEGHVGVTKELLAFQTAEKKYYIGCEKGGANLIKVTALLLCTFEKVLENCCLIIWHDNFLTKCKDTK